MKYLILAEKPDAARSFAKALGGFQGSYKGIDYVIVHAAGHLLSLEDPDKMVSSDLVPKYKSWDVANLPWKMSEMSFKKKIKGAFQADLIKKIKAAAATCDVFVIATDVDESCEGDLIGWDVVDVIKWSGPVYRMPIIDETPEKVRLAFDKIYQLPKKQDTGAYLKAITRRYWDFMSMQEVRIATHAANRLGYDVLLRNGRLKSVIISEVFRQEEAIRNYVKKPYFEARYKDDKGNVYKRKFEDGDTFRFDQASSVDLNDYTPSAVKEISRVTKKKVAPKLPVTDDIVSAIAPKGYSSEAIMEAYQKMYEAGVLSYPRTENHYIGTDEFNELLPFAEKIANLVGVDASLLTERSPRKAHVKDGAGSHGANRPGLKVPDKMSDLVQYSSVKGLAETIYDFLARRYLAILSSDYVYESIDGALVDKPEFTTKVNKVLDLGYKAVYDDSKKDDEKEEKLGSELGTNATSFVYEGSNKKPSKPTINWLMSRLKKLGVGTGATRVQTITELVKDKKNLQLKESKAVLSLTSIGALNGCLLQGTQIGNPEITGKLEEGMNAVERKELNFKDVVSTVNKVVAHDLKVMMSNLESAKSHIESRGLNKDLSKRVMKPKTERVEGMYVTGENISFVPSIKGYTLSDDEIKQALTGQEFTVSIPLDGGIWKPILKLAKSEKYGWGLSLVKKEKKSADDISEMKPSWGGYSFSDDEKRAMLAGEGVEVPTKKARALIKYGLTSYKGNEYYGYYVDTWL